MFDILGVLLEALSGKAVPSGDAAESATRRVAQRMLAQAAGMESSPDPGVRKMGQEMRARASAVLNYGTPTTAARQAPAVPPASTSKTVSAVIRPASPGSATTMTAPAAPAAKAAPAVPHSALTRHLLADAHHPASLLRTIVWMEALGAPLALRDELGGPFTHR